MAISDQIIGVESGGDPNATGSLDPQYLDAIKGFEGYSDQPFWDYKQSTSGYGTRAQPGDENIPADQRRAVYEQRFKDETGKAAASVDNFAPNLPPGVRAALTSLTYNAGPAWQQSGLGAAIRSGDYDKAKDIFLQYNKAGGQVNPGLVARRQQEAAWFAGQPGPQPQTAPASPAAPANTPLQLAQQAPIFAQAPQALAPAPALQAPQVDQAQAQPIFAPQRKPIDLSGLQAALAARQPIFARQG